MNVPDRIAILGGGNIGAAIASGLCESGKFRPDQIAIVRRKVHLLDPFKKRGFLTLADNREAVRWANMIIVSVLPQHAAGVLKEVGPDLDPAKHIIVSIVTGISISEIVKHVGKRVPVVRAMPNIAIAMRESMTCLAAKDEGLEALEMVVAIFDALGTTLVIDEEQMIPATALAACGVAFFLRAIRAASQGGIEIGFHSAEALAMAAQTAKGAAVLLGSSQEHPEAEVDKVTTPMGCTIAGLNQMEHYGFSSSMIRGIITSAEKAAKLYQSETES